MKRAANGSLTAFMLRLMPWRTVFACSAKSFRYMKTRAAKADAATIKGTAKEAMELAEVERESLGADLVVLVLLAGEVDVLLFSLRRVVELAGRSERPEVEEEASGGNWEESDVLVSRSGVERIIEVSI